MDNYDFSFTSAPTSEAYSCADCNPNITAKTARVAPTYTPASSSTKSYIIFN